MFIRTNEQIKWKINKTTLETETMTKDRELQKRVSWRLCHNARKVAKTFSCKVLKLNDCFLKTKKITYKELGK